MRKTTRKKYNRINKKRVFILICLIMLVIFEIVAFRNSRANKIIDIAASIIDDEENLDAEEIILEASNSGNSGYFVILPEYINNKRIDSYIIKEKDIHTQEKSESKVNTEKNEQVVNNIDKENVQTVNNVVTEKENEQVSDNIVTEKENAQVLNDTIINSENIYEDVKKKSEPTFNTMFSDQLADYNASNDVYEKLGEDI